MANKDTKMTIEDLAGTIDDLAVAVAKGFGGVTDQFVEANKRFDRLENDLGGLRQEFNSFRSETRENFNRLWQEIGNINCKLTAIEKRTFGDTGTALEEIEKLKKRINLLEKKLKAA